MHPNLPLDQILIGDCRKRVKTLPDESVNCVVTSPPYWGLRSYGTDPQIWANGHEPCIEHQWNAVYPAGYRGNDSGDPKKPYLERRDVLKSNTCSICGAWRGELGLEPQPEMYVAHLVEIFREVKRVLRDDGTLWLNLGDSYANNPSTSKIPRIEQGNGTGVFRIGDEKHTQARRQTPNRLTPMKESGLKPKDLVGIPWMVAFALRADGWYLRSDIIWAKPNPMPESVTDRPTKAHEYIFLLSKSQKYYYDADAVREPIAEATVSRNRYPHHGAKNLAGAYAISRDREPGEFGDELRGRNRRTVWTVATHPFKGAHFATFPPKLIEPCILAGTSARGVCPTCGAPWERVTEKTRSFESGSGRSENLPTGKNGKYFQGGGVTPDIRMGPTLSVATTGWYPTCDCDVGEPVPAVVLDPFMGSGTTASVCISLKRHYIGFDLNPAYVEGIAQDRADTTPPPLFVL